MEKLNKPIRVPYQQMTDTTPQVEAKTPKLYLLVHSGEVDDSQLVPAVIWQSTNKAHVMKLLEHLKQNNQYDDALSIVELD